VRAAQELKVRHRKEQGAREMQLLEAVVGTSDTAVGVRLFGVRPLHDACGELFTKLARRYGDILTEVVESGGGDLDPSNRVAARHHACGARRAPPPRDAWRSTWRPSR
jgi:hypothetical protein